MAFETIPGPPGLPIIGNIGDIDAENHMLSFGRLTDTYGSYAALARRSGTHTPQGPFGNSTSPVIASSSHHKP